MSRPVVVVVGPKAVTGPGVVDPDMAAIALECIDDHLALPDDVVVPVDDLWRDVLASAIGGARGAVLLIFPSWWSDSRVERVAEAAGRSSGDVVVRRRFELAPRAATVVELAAELVVVHADSQRHPIARGDGVPGIVDGVIACVDGSTVVTVDVPTGFALLGADLASAMRHRGIDVTVTDDRTLYTAGSGSGGPSRRWRPTPRAAAVAVAILTAGALAAAAVASTPEPPDEAAASWLIEGRVAVEVPDRWTVERVTSGPGSARVQVFSPDDPAAVIHLTQSRVPDAQTLEDAAEVLESALAEQPAGVFVDFVVGGQRVHRAAVTYRELRSDRRIDWTVLLDGGVRIAIGCQGTADAPGPEAPCDRAIRSAHAVTPK